uniref:ORF1; putative n=1 Tax=Pseudomonas syringae TaxID=317 RepID=Q9R9F1_PSESX|nr:unnamed protein product [Pseudomonas syringae]
MSNPRYPEEFKIQAVNQVTEKKLPVADVAARLGVSTHSLYAWIKRYSKPQAERQQDDDQHADQGSQYSSSDWRSFLKANNLVASMSRRGNCHDNAVAESFFQLLKRERIKRKIYTSRQDARSDVFDYIEMFYNPKRRHGFNNQLSPVEFEKRYAMSLQGV